VVRLAANAEDEMSFVHLEILTLRAYFVEVDCYPLNEVDPGVR
jgi:hypothetical protein